MEIENLLNWFITILALTLAILGFYFQYLKKGKLICRLERHIIPAIDVDLDKETCKIGVTVIFENNQKKDWVITNLFLEYRIPGEIGTKITYLSLPDGTQYLLIPKGQTIAKDFEITLPLKSLEFYIAPSPPRKSRVKSNSEWHHPFTHIIPFWNPPDDEESLLKLVKLIAEKCPEQHIKMCMELMNQKTKGKILKFHER